MDHKVYCYNEQTENGGNKVVEVTGDEILLTYWPYWKEQMERVGRNHLISVDACIDDFVTVHWAWEKQE